MKDSVKKIFLVLCAASVMLISTTAFATPTSEPTRTTKTISASGSSVSTDESTSSGTTDSSDTTDTSTASGEGDTSDTTTTASGVVQDSSKPVPTAISTGQQSQQNVVQNTEAQRAAEKKYASKGSLAVWFILSILINIIISFVIGNRFYRLSRKDNHVNAEIRALRRDLEEKFVDHVGGFSEMEMDVTNTNDNYSMNGSIKMPERKSTDFASESEDVFKRWESQMSQRRAAKRVVAEPIEEDEPEEEETEERHPKRKFQPTRARMAAHEEDEPDYEDSEEEENSVAQTVKNKAKNLLGDIFPFKED